MGAHGFGGSDALHVGRRVQITDPVLSLDGADAIVGEVERTDVSMIIRLYLHEPGWMRVTVLTLP